MPLDRDTFITLGLEDTIPEEINGRRNGVNNDPAWDAAYHPCPEAFPDEAIPTGTVTRFEQWSESEIYSDTSRDLWIYQPPGFDPDRPQRILFFNDGAAYVHKRGPVRATRVLDSFHHDEAFASTVAVFINPGMPEHPVTEKPVASYGDRESQRSLEYDKMTPAYGQFLFTEILPFVEQQLQCQISENPQDKIVCGISSGGIAAFTAAWHYPEICNRVISHCGSYTNIWGGHNYPAMVRSTEKKPIRVYLQSGTNDANTPFGDWALANQTMASALEYAGYDYHFEFGVGGHSLKHGGALFADALRWIWRESSSNPS